MMMRSKLLLRTGAPAGRACRELPRQGQGAVSTEAPNQFGQSGPTRTTGLAPCPDATVTGPAPD